MGAVKKTSGYLVSGEAALMALTEVSPEAAAWWRVNAPNFVRPGRYFVFQDGACTPMSEGRGKIEFKYLKATMGGTCRT